MKTLVTICAVVLLITGMSQAAFNEGFEGTPNIDLAATGGGSAVLSADNAHSGSQSVKLSLNSTSDYGRVKMNISSYGYTVADVAASAWVYRAAGGDTEQSPFIMFDVATPGGSSLLIMYNNPSLQDNTWSQWSFDRAKMPFHAVSDTTGIGNPNYFTLDDLSTMPYSTGVTWGTFLVTNVRVGAGLGGNNGIASTFYVDDVSVTPEPATMALLGLGGLFFARRKK